MSTDPRTPPSTEPPEVDEPPHSKPAAWRHMLGRMAAPFRPWLRQTWLNLRAWIPFLWNPYDRKRLVRFAARDDRVGLKWQIALPKRCIACQSEETLEVVEYRGRLITCEHPVGILGASLAAMSIVILLSCLLEPWMALLLLVLMPTLGLLILKLKSWPEEYRLAVFRCGEHREMAWQPEIVIYDDEFHLIVPTPELAALTWDEIAAKRRSKTGPGMPLGGNRGSASASTSPTTPGSSGSQTANRTTAPTPAPDLPPIRLAGEEDETKET